MGVASGGAGVGWVAPGWVWLPFASVGSYVRVAVCAIQWWVSIYPGRSAESEERDGWRREPDDSAMMEAYFDAKCGGEDGDWADIAFEVSLYEF